MSPATQTVGGPFFDDLHVGLVADSAPALTLTEGVAAAHGAIVGDRMRLALDAELSRRVLGSALAHPALVWDVANGQSTLFTQRVIANLFYRGFMFRRAPSIGDTLYTTTEVVGLRQNRPRPGRAATGLAALRVRTTDQKGRAVLDYTRCAMLPLRNPEGQTGHNADLETIGAELDARRIARADRGLEPEGLSRRRAGLALRRSCRGNGMGGHGRRRRIVGSRAGAADAEYRDGASRRRLQFRGAAGLRRPYDRIGGGPGDSRAAQPGHDCRVARMRSPCAGPRGRHFAQHARTRTRRAA